MIETEDKEEIMAQLKELRDSSTLSLLKLQVCNMTAHASALITHEEMSKLTDKVEAVSRLEKRLERDLAFEETLNHLKNLLNN